jgi:hypothetical protein
MSQSRVSAVRSLGAGSVLGEGQQDWLQDHQRQGGNRRYGTELPSSDRFSWNSLAFNKDFLQMD